jgi:alpha-L-fucosidase
MKRLLIALFMVCFSNSLISQVYVPSPLNLEARKEFQDMKFGMFIHWGVFSIPGDGEWVMNNRNIHVNEYRRLMKFFNPIDFDAKKWVQSAINGGMKYMTFITRHHDGFSNWDTKATDWKITNTPYHKDVLKMLADECHKRGIKLFVYYSLLDWTREDYPWHTGRTGHGTGRTGTGNYDHYLQFMKQQLTELLTNYGEIAGVWFDGHWDQTAPEGAKDRTSQLDWHYNEIYSLIHKLQPQCMIGNNHHLLPFEGEDFQMFERDLPGENKSGLNYQKTAEALPLETCETMNGSWGFNITDRNYKSTKQIIDLLVNAAGRNSNLLLNVGPMPNGEIQPEFTDTLVKVGAWLKQNGISIYGTRGKIIPPQSWGVVTGKNKMVYVHLLKKITEPSILLPDYHGKIKNASLLSNGKKINFRQAQEGTYLSLDAIDQNDIDTIIGLQIY